MRATILQPQQQDMLAKLRALLLDLYTTLVSFGATPEDESAVRQSQLQLDSLFLLVIAGEFNAGKSAFINALLGERILEEGVATTSRIHLVNSAPPLKLLQSMKSPTKSLRPSNFFAKSISSIRPAPTPSNATTKPSPKNSCRAPISSSSSPLPTARLQRANASS